MGFNDGIDHFKSGNYHNALNLTARNDHLHRRTQLIGVMQLFSYLESNLHRHLPSTPFTCTCPPGTPLGAAGSHPEQRSSEKKKKKTGKKTAMD